LCCAPAEMLPFVNVPFAYFQGVTGSSVDELKLITSFILSYPLAAVLKRIPDEKPWLKNVFIIAVALFYLIGLFDLWGGVVTLSISAAGAYAISAYIDSPLMPWVGFVFLMGHMSVSHIYRQIAADPSVIDITGAQMVMVMKLSAFCWNVQDGRSPEKDLVDFQKEHAVRKMPALLDYIGYVLFFPSLMAGPAFDYVDYQRWLETTMFQIPPGTDPASAPKTRKQRKIPRSGTPAAIKAAKGLAWILLFLAIGGWYTPELVLSEQYAGFGFTRRVWILQMLGFTTRLKYYGVWTLTEGACILSGLGYNGIDPKTGRVDWDRLRNVNPLAIETAQNSRAYLENWNINTNHWLRNYVYLRVTPKGKKPGFRASLATFITSAFWHGFYPGYYLTFILAAFIQTAAKSKSARPSVPMHSSLIRTDFRRHIRPLFLTPDGTRPSEYKRYYDFVTYVGTQAVFSFATAPFVVLSLSHSLLVWRRVYFYVVIGVFATLAAFASPAKAWLTRQQGIQTIVFDEQQSTGEKVGAAAVAAEGTRPEIKREENHSQGGILGVPEDPETDIDEIVNEVLEKIEVRREGERIKVPKVGEVRSLVEKQVVAIREGK